MKNIVFVVLFSAIMSVIGSQNATALDPSYVITMSNPKSNDLLYSKTPFTIAGNVNWLFYKPNIDKVNIITFDTQTLSTKDNLTQNIPYSIFSRSCNFSQLSTMITSPGNYGVLIQAEISGVVVNQKTLYIY
jgi:hypothetical protein